VATLSRSLAPKPADERWAGQIVKSLSPDEQIVLARAIRLTEEKPVADMTSEEQALVDRAVALVERGYQQALANLERARR
jgi:alkylated DNA nucleotide flippase Atl1